ncbi:hypothetical protein [Vibrio furnissii]
MVDKELVCGLESNDGHYLKLHVERGQGLSQQITALLAEHHQTLHPVQEADDI